MKYIDGTLNVVFKLDTTSKSKPVVGPDDLLLMLVQHWARDESVFPTEDERHDVATIMLFQAYTGGRPAEFVHSSKGKASEDTLGEREEEEIKKNTLSRKAAHGDYNDKNKDVDVDDELECDDDSYAGDDLEFDDDILFDSEDDESDDEAMDEHGYSDSGYNSDETGATMTEDTNKWYTTELDQCGQPLRQNSDDIKPGEFEEAKRKYKALCYEDICLWIVKNPKQGERDLLAMEVHLQNHKGVDNKPKPYVALARHLEP